MPLFSVIIPTRNREHFLKQAVASVLAQSERDFELLIVNDGDVGIALFEDERIRIIDNHKNGHVPARNNGITNARGDLIAFLDDDDLFLDADHLQRAAHLISSGADFTFTDAVMTFSGGGERIFAHDADAASLEHNNTILVSGICYRRTIHATLGTFDESLPYYWDWDWYLRVTRANFTIVRDPHRSIAIRVHGTNMSGAINLAARQANLDRMAHKHRLGRLVLKTHVDFVS
jgi:glycosyltransferase involved in cell wall biosynthesis